MQTAEYWSVVSDETQDFLCERHAQEAQKAGELVEMDSCPDSPVAPCDRCKVSAPKGWDHV